MECIRQIVKREALRGVQLPRHWRNRELEIIVMPAETKDAKRPVYGSGKGKMWISDDFDAPLDELKEYME